MNDTKPLSLYDFQTLIPDEEAATDFFEQRRWGDEPYCPHCGSGSTRAIPNKTPMPYRCKDCRKHFSVRTKTVLAESPIPLHKWLMAIYLLHTARKGVSSKQLERELGVTYKTAWFLSHRIREAMASRGGLFSGEVEIDEAYIGGKEKNKHASKREHLGRGGIGKQAVVGLKSRKGHVRAVPIRHPDRSTLHTAIVENVQRGSTIYSDGLPAYVGLPGYKHYAVGHSTGEYVRGKAHTNGIESFWALLKRGYVGTHHYMSFKHLHRYVNEFAYRWNVGPGNTLDVLARTVDGMIGRRLTYRDLVSEDA